MLMKNLKLLATASCLAAGCILTAWTAVSQSQNQNLNPPPPVFISSGPATAAQGADFAVNMSIDASQKRGELKPIYRFFGADEPNYAYMEDGLKLLGDIGKLGKPQTFFRAHNMMTTGDGTPAYKWGSTNMYTEDAQGNPVYDWKISDQIIEAYLKNGVKPYMQIGFMPKAMSTNPDPYQHSWSPGQPYGNIYTGWAYPPKSYDKWRELVYQWVKHCVEKYGKAEVEQWYWETWNEPNAGSPANGTSAPARGAYWMGSGQDFHKLHDYAIDGVKKALPTAKVGGPDTAGAGGAWMRAFLEHCLTGTNYANGQKGTPTDFIAFHAKGSPTFVDAGGQTINAERMVTTPGHVRMGISNQLRAVNDGFAIVASYPDLKSKPIIIGESDPDGCAGCRATHYPQYGYRNTELYASYTAASYARKHDLADRHGVNLEGAITWAFEFEDQPIFAGFRVMVTEGGINLPVFNVFRMMGKMTGQKLAVESDGAISLDEMMRNGARGEKPDVSAIAAIDGNTMTILSWYYHDDELPGPDAAVKIALKSLPANGAVQMTQYRVDRDHTNPFAMWKKMGSPEKPTAAQMSQLVAEGNLKATGPAQPLAASGGNATIEMKLPRQGVALTVLTW